VLILQDLAGIGLWSYIDHSAPIRGGYAKAVTGRSPDDVVCCGNPGCTVVEHVTMAELAKNPALIPEHCGLPTEVVSLDEVEQKLAKARLERGE